MSDEPVAQMLLKVLSNLHYLVTGKAHLLQRGTRARQSGGTPRFEQGRDAGDKSRAEELSTQVLMCVCVCVAVIGTFHLLILTPEALIERGSLESEALIERGSGPAPVFEPLLRRRANLRR